MGNYESFQFLVKSLKDKDKGVRYSVIDALKKITKKNFSYDHENPSSEKSKKAIEQYKKWWEKEKQK